jgi:hypothetical protein
LPRATYIILHEQTEMSAINKHIEGQVTVLYLSSPPGATKTILERYGNRTPSVTNTILESYGNRTPSVTNTNVLDPTFKMIN